MAQLIAMLVGMRGETQEMNGRMQRMNDNLNNKMDGMAQTVREEMQNMGAGLQDGLEKLKIGNGELLRATESRETCWARREKVTETVTVRELNGVTETCTRHIETRETRREVTELVETREVEERLHGVEVKDAYTHTHTGSEGQWG